MRASTAGLAVALSLMAPGYAFVQPSSFVGNRAQLSAVRSSAGMQMVTKEELLEAREALVKLIDSTNCAPIMVRLAWHDSGTYNKDIPVSEWPRCGGANGSIRFEPEINHGANAGLVNGLKLLEPIHKKHPNVGWADLMQLASATAVEVAGGPKIDMRYGRKTVESPEGCADEGYLPAAAAPFPDGSPEPQGHLRKVFYRMGIDDRGIVALSGAHTLGRAYPERSGFGKDSTKYTDGSTVIRGDGKPGIGRKGGQSWTYKWLSFDNSYFSIIPETDEELLKLETDNALFLDEAMRPIALEYKKDQDKFFDDYAKAHKQLAELGSVFEPEGGIAI
eukprot:TRINITY_DN3064_c0_g1_i1.p1 TRINITY_DN3064_c0_g1~~TRINITY_DN3064_c0_g1_i1.p1  ORF type:complete len:359 (-),score=126.84 TRINITY_DN3064_c0_g1_i1:308-1309(-)